MLVVDRGEEVDVDLERGTATTLLQGVGRPVLLECSVCLTPVDPTYRAGYMLTPCNHLFHSECLERAMAYKLECPVCRTGLPPL